MQHTECAGVCMSVTPYLDELDADPETKRVLAVALEMTRISLGLEDDFANGMIAKQLIEIAKTGERNPDLLCEGSSKRSDPPQARDGQRRQPQNCRHDHFTNAGALSLVRRPPTHRETKKAPDVPGF